MSSYTDGAAGCSVLPPVELTSFDFGCDGVGESDFYNPFINNTNTTAFVWKTKLADGTWVSLATLTRNGSFTAASYTPKSGTTAPTGACSVPGQLYITADGHVRKTDGTKKVDGK